MELMKNKKDPRIKNSCYSTDNTKTRQIRENLLPKVTN